ncbi:hypothetical protein Poli38472_006667 [Pythium oligandrum]|uniref:Jacalin-type lectin domain-containing protein n=1 Tax=Pythium oligandrum TaxID=41045 RepID=A0A8K1FEH8_PYTOL|nr:hypothetical protein Poli38472_006667 [Pythium oligandrum]|eukprot:TMW56657.1 hypothetical protein Poli38472_006667 [Pythium oligandrum]
MEAPEVTAVQAEGRGEEAVDVGETENLRAPRPHESPLLNPIGLFDKDKVQTSFGYTWQERLFSIGAFEICTSSDRIQSIRNRTLDVFVLNALQATGDTHVFHLFPHEKLLKVEVTATPGVISSVRFVTNLRTSIWFGCHANGALRVFDAPEGHMIHCLYGTYGEKLCRQLGVFYRPEVSP